MEEGSLAGPSYTQHAAAGHVCYGERGCQCQQRGQEEDGTVDARRWAIAVVPQQPWVSRMSDVGSAVTR